MSKVQLADGIYWVGVIDWNLRNFHGYSTRLGTTYNAYLIVDEKITLIDTVKAPFYDEMVTRIEKIVPMEDIDYVISNHVGRDPEWSLPEVMKKAKKAQLITMEKFGENGLKKNFHQDWPMIPVREGTQLKLGKRTATFIPTPMLHWPDSMCTYLLEDHILFSMDAFGQHLATSQRFDDEVGLDTIMPEAAKYYANILMPFGDLIVKAVDKLGGLKISMTAPSHGIIWRSYFEDIAGTYANWGKGVTKNKALVIYDTMWGSTATMAKVLAESIACEGVEVRLYNLTDSDKSDIVTEVLDAGAVLVGSPTLNNGMFPSVAEFLCYIKGLKPKGKIGAAFGSHGWAGGSVKAVEQELGLAGIEVINSNLAFKFAPVEDEIQKCIDFGKTIAMRIKKLLIYPWQKDLECQT